MDTQKARQCFEQRLLLCILQTVAFVTFKLIAALHYFWLAVMRDTVDEGHIWLWKD